MLAFLVTALLASPALATSSEVVTFEGSRDLLEDTTWQSTLDEIDALGARGLRVILYWNDVAPSPNSAKRPSFDASDPAAYPGFGKYDRLLEAAHAKGMKVVLTLSGPVPKWATAARKDNLTRPRASEFQKFAAAVGKRYKNLVTWWAIWNEPNHPDFLAPQYSAKGHKPLSPGIYRQLFLAGWRGLRSTAGDPYLLMGETAPRGTGKVVAPLTFLRGALCLSSRYVKRKGCSNLPADGYAHHAYTTAQGPLFKPKQPNDVTIGVISRLITALNRARSAGAVDRRLNVHLTEFGIQSTPDPIVGVSQARQSDYRAISERLAYDQSRVVAFSQYLLRDDPPKAGAPLALRYPGFESGLRTNAGKAKPALTGFRLPLAALRRGSRVALWGLVRPATGRTRVTVQYTSGGSFKTLFTTRTDSRGYFTRNTTFRSGRRYRLVWTQPGGDTVRGTTTSVYRR
jgi:hypothetical protein